LLSSSAVVASVSCRRGVHIRVSSCDLCRTSLVLHTSRVHHADHRAGCCSRVVVQVVFGRQPGRTLSEYGDDAPSLLSRSRFLLRRRLPFLFGRKSSRLPSVYLTSLGYRSKDSVFNSPVLVGTDSKGVTRVLKFAAGRDDELVRADFMTTQSGIVARHSIAYVRPSMLR
jgi:hypothetical protein